MFDVRGILWRAFSKVVLEVIGKIPLATFFKVGTRIANEVHLRQTRELTFKDKT